MFSGMNYVYEVYKEQSFSKAAENLYISQPALSSMIKKIETKIGMPLFDRSTSPIQLTECGKKYIKTAEKIMDLENEFAYYVGNLQELKTGRLSVGGTYLFSSFIFPPIIDKFRRAYPHVKLNLFEGHTPLLEQKLFAGELDIIIDNYLLDAGIYEKERFMEERLLLAVPTEGKTLPDGALSHQDILHGRHLQADAPAVSIDLFRDSSFIALRHGNDTRIRMDQLCEQAGFVPHIQLEVDQLSTAYNIVCSNMGLTLVSDTLISRTAPVPQMVYYKINSSLTERSAYFYYKSGAYVTLAMQEFIKTGVQQAPHIGQPLPAE